MTLQDEIDEGIRDYNRWFSDGKLALAAAFLDLLRLYNVRLTVGDGGVLARYRRLKLVHESELWTGK